MIDAIVSEKAKQISDKMQIGSLKASAHWKRYKSALIQVRAEDDAEDADDSASHVSVSLKGARELFAKGKIFVQDNQSNPSMQKFLDSVEGLVRALEAMTLSSRTHQSALSN